MIRNVMFEMHRQESVEKLISTSTLCYIFAVGEVVGGIYAGSLAIKLVQLFCLIRFLKYLDEAETF
jgi:hypothetical protein